MGLTLGYHEGIQIIWTDHIFILVILMKVLGS